MNHPTHPSRNSMSQDFFTFGNEGIGLNQAAERRAVEQADRHLAAALHTPGPLGSLRRRAGSLLIAIGTAVAGAVPCPNPDTAEHGAA